MAATPSSMPSSMQTSRMLRAALDLLARDGRRPSSYLSVLDEAPERGRAGDVGALADDRRSRLSRRDRERLEAGQAHVRGGVGRSAAARHALDGGARSRRCARGACRSSRRRGSACPRRRTRAEHAGHVLGRVVVARRTRWAGRRSGSRRRTQAAIRASSATCGRMSSAPSAQLIADGEQVACRHRVEERLDRSGPTACGRSGRGS